MINWEDSEDGHDSRLGNVATIVHNMFHEEGAEVHCYYLNTQVGDHEERYDEPFYSLVAAKIAAVEALRPQYDALHAVFSADSFSCDCLHKNSLALAKAAVCDAFLGATGSQELADVELEGWDAVDAAVEALDKLRTP